MTYIVQRKVRFYVVAYDGIDPLTGLERRRWLPVGHDRTEAEMVAAQVDGYRLAAPLPSFGPRDRDQPPSSLCVSPATPSLRQGGPLDDASFLPRA
jgi:hypothetical protein